LRGYFFYKKISLVSLNIPLWRVSVPLRSFLLRVTTVLVSINFPLWRVSIALGSFLLRVPLISFFFLLKDCIWSFWSWSGVDLCHRNSLARTIRRDYRRNGSIFFQCSLFGVKSHFYKLKMTDKKSFNGLLSKKFSYFNLTIK